MIFSVAKGRFCFALFALLFQKRLRDLLKGMSIGPSICDLGLLLQNARIIARSQNRLNLISKLWSMLQCSRRTFSKRQALFSSFKSTFKPTQLRSCPHNLYTQPFKNSFWQGYSFGFRSFVATSARGKWRRSLETKTS